jgi:hypothetical protein
MNWLHFNWVWHCYEVLFSHTRYALIHKRLDSQGQLE